MIPFSARIAAWIRTTALYAGAVATFFAANAQASPVHIRSIGIISALGDTCMFERVPDTRFEWISPPLASFLEISDWRINDEVTNIIAKQLAAYYQVQPIAIEEQDFDTWTYRSLARHIRELPIPEIPVDTYLLVLRDWRHDGIGNSNHQVGGLGVYRRDRRGSISRFGVFASYRLMLLDANNGALIGQRPALLPEARLPWLAAPPALWPQTPNDLTNAQQSELRADFKMLINSTLSSTLQSLGIVPIIGRHRPHVASGNE